MIRAGSLNAKQRCFLAFVLKGKKITQVDSLNAAVVYESHDEFNSFVGALLYFF